MAKNITPKKMNEATAGLTIKQKKFVKEYIASNGNGTQSALKSYDTSDKKTASVIATENLGKPSIQQSLQSLMADMGLTDKYLLRKLDRGLKDKDNRTMHKFLKTAFDLKGHTGERLRFGMKQDGDKVEILLDMKG